MATSGTVTFRNTRDELIKGALRLVGGYDIENTAGPTTNQIASAAEALNQYVKFLETKGLELWERKYGAIFPQKNQQVYQLGSPGPGGDHSTLATPIGVGGFVWTTLSSAATSGASSVLVASTTSPSSTGVSAVTISDTYNIGIELDTGYIQWTTVSGTPSGTTVGLASGLTSAAAAGNTVFCYQTKLVRPLRILDAFVRQPTGQDTPVNLIPRENYNRFGLKSGASSIPTQLYYDPQANTMHVYTYPAFQDVNNVLFIEFQHPIQDFASSADDFDLPQEWGLVIKYNLALMLAPEYEVTSEKFKQIQYLASSYFDQVGSWDQETSSLFLQPSADFTRHNDS